MAKGLFLAWLNPVDDNHDAELNAWYEGTHIGQVRAAIPSVTAVHRYRTADLPGAQQPPHRYLAVYEMDSADVAVAAAALGLAGSEGRLDMTNAIDYADTPPVIQWYQGLAG
jgi:endonuclease/exonuclease/phosphatase family metal-dependent hydrolase